MSGDFTFLKGNIETIILCALYNNDKYGYEIVREIKERTDNRYEIKQPTLYSYLKRLEDDGLIVSYWGESSNGGRRRYYKLTKEGRSNCEQFISEWEYQRNVMSDLVDGTANAEQITQEEATPLFGRRSPRRSKKREIANSIDEQDEIARRLRELTSESDEQPSESEKDEYVDPAAMQQQSIFDEAIYSEPEQVSYDEFIIAEPPAPVEEPEPQPEPEPVKDEETVATISEEEQLQQAKARFEVHQDDAEEFMQAFEERAKEVSERSESGEQRGEGENYQHVLMGVLGDQLDGVQQAETATAAASAAVYYESRSAALEDVADNLAKEGIRMRIYNRATANYKSKTLIPQAKVLCQAGWLTYLVAVVFFGIVLFTSIAYDNWLPHLITLAVLLLVPIGLSIYAILHPARIEKPQYNFRLAIIVTSAILLIAVLASIGFSALGNMEFSDYVAVANQILIPTGIALLFPAYALIYKLLYDRY